MAAKKKAEPAKKKPAPKAAKPAKRVAARPAKKAAKKSAARKPAAKKKITAIPVVHWEIQAVDAKRMHGFYSDLFGWTIDTNNPMGYGMVASGGGQDAINGGIGDGPGGPSRVVVYAQVSDIDATLAKAESLGAKTMLPRTDMGPVTLAIFEDIEGNAFGIIEGD